MNWQISVPSKTFLLGEYLVLKGGPALVLTTRPRFKVSITANGDTQSSFPTHSPADNYIKKNFEIFKSYQVEFKNPYNDISGFGASTAEFLSLWGFVQSKKNMTLDPEKLLHDYLSCIEGKGPPPSGADLLAQLMGKICYFNRNENHLESVNWPFLNLGFCLINTGQKLATHVHLQSLTNLKLEKLNPIARKGWEGLQSGDQAGFLAAINCYGKELKELGLLAEHSFKILQGLDRQPAILAAKGCGAMGAEVIACFYQLAGESSLISWLKTNFHVVYHGQELAEGLQIESCN